MSCSHPLRGYVLGINPSTGKKIVKIVPFGDISLSEKGLEELRVPCGQCLGCRIDKSRAWADRMMLQLDTDKKALFATMTYSDDNLRYSPSGLPTVCVRDFQLFMKLLRKKFPDRQLKYYASFEYGDRTFRPHCHAIIFGIDLDDFDDKVLRGRNKLNDPWYSSAKFASIWKLGICCLCNVSWKTMAYTARYVQKKLTGELKNVYGDRVPPCAVMSRNPGIGAKYLEQHPDLYELTEINVPGASMQIPKYFLRKLSLTDPDLYDKIMLGRKEFAEYKSKLELGNTDLYEDEYLKVKEKKFDSSIRALRRELE